MLVAGKYRLESKLSEGGVGVVYLARHIGLSMFNERVIKVLKPSLFAKDGAKERFHREVQLTANLSEHNYHIVRIYDDFGEEPQLGPYYVMEYLRGESLGERLEQASPLPLPLTFYIFEQLCDAMGAAHRANIIHRDLKPENIFLTQRDKDADFVKILDFGLARPTDTGANVTQGVFGTPAYMSPEQCQGNPVDDRTDIYSMSIILYEMLTGELPYQVPRNETMTLLVAHISQNPTPLLNHRPDLPAGLDGALMRGLSKSPEDRFATVEEFWDAVSLYSSGTNPVTNPTGPMGLYAPTANNAALSENMVPATLGYGGNAISFIAEDEDEPTFVTEEPFSFHPDRPPAGPSVDPNKTLASDSVPEELLRAVSNNQDADMVGESTEIGTPAVLDDSAIEEIEYNLEELLFDDPEEEKASMLSLETESSAPDKDDGEEAPHQPERTVRAVNPLTRPRANSLKDTDPLAVDKVESDLDTQEEKLSSPAYGPARPTEKQLALSGVHTTPDRSKKEQPEKTTRERRALDLKKSPLFPSMRAVEEKKLSPRVKPGSQPLVSVKTPPKEMLAVEQQDVLIQGAKKQTNVGVWLLVFLLLALGIFSASIYLILGR